jgi:hypothetical protein
LFPNIYVWNGLAVDNRDQSKRHHSYADKDLYVKSNYNAEAQLPLVPGNFEEKVASFAYGDWQQMDQRYAARQKPKIYNVSDRGARFRGTKVIQPSDLNLDSIDCLNKDALIKFFNSHQFDKKDQY